MAYDAQKPTIRASHEVRLTFEQLGTYVVLAALGLGCLAALVSTFPYNWAGIVGDHVIKIASTLVSFVATLGGVLGLSWGRGHMDQRLDVEK